MSRHAPYPAATVQVTVRGHLPGAEDYAIKRVREVQRFAPEPVLAARVKLTKHTDPAVANRYVAQANLDMRGRLVRAQATSRSLTESVDLLHDRLRRRLEKSARNWEAIRGHFPGEGGWRHGQQSAHRETFYPRPVEEREVVRHKAYSVARLSVDDAADVMESMDYDFHLFTESGSGQDSVLYGTADGYRLAQLNPARGRIQPATAVTVAVSEQPAPELSHARARERLNLSGQPFLFFRDPQSHRGDVLYHRYDGHYGLITPADRSR